MARILEIAQYELSTPFKKFILKTRHIEQIILRTFPPVNLLNLLAKYSKSLNFKFY